jgi:hypothetical protein
LHGVTVGGFSFMVFKIPQSSSAQLDICTRGANTSGNLLS